MYKETDAVTAFMQYKMGGNGIMLHENGEIWPMAEAFKQFDNARFIVDFPEEKKEPEKAVAVPDAETPLDDPFSRIAARGGTIHDTPHRKRGKPTNAEKAVIEERILKAWNGERSIQDVVRMTGYDYRTVRKYLPETVNG